jgi:hypothetical protein
MLNIERNVINLTNWKYSQHFFTMKGMKKKQKNVSRRGAELAEKRENNKSLREKKKKILLSGHKEEAVFII